jgi:GNAT superfamily N-acetyltransferase
MAGVDREYPFCDLHLARRLDRAEGYSGAMYVEARARCFPQSKAEWIEVAGAYALYDGADSPVTQTFGLGLFELATSAVLERVEAFFGDRGAPVSHDVSPLAGVALAALLHGRGYHPIEFASVMYRPVGRGAGAVRSGNDKIRVRAIGGNEGDLWARTAAKGWNEIPELTGYLLTLGPISTQREDSISLLAELDGQAIAAGTICFDGRVALLAGACTIPEGRRQGAQLALLEARLRYAAERGCDVAMMCAEPGSASQRNAERHGFRIAYTRTKWQRPAAAGAP